MASNGDKAVFLSFLNQMADWLKVDVRVVHRASEPQPVLGLFPTLHSNRLILPDEVVSNFFGESTLHMSAFMLNCVRPTRGMPFFTWASSFEDGSLNQLWRRSGRRELSHVNLVKHILGLPSQVPAESIELGQLPIVPDLAFFAPAANYVKVNYRVFLPLAAQCRQNGLRVAWNFSENEFSKLDTEFKQQIAADVLFKGNLPEALRMAKMSKLVVSARSGFCELLALSHCRFGIVYGSEWLELEKIYWNLDSLACPPIFEVDANSLDNFRLDAYL
jgi:hypothetical protein